MNNPKVDIGLSLIYPIELDAIQPFSLSLQLIRNCSSEIVPQRFYHGTFGNCTADFVVDFPVMSVPIVKGLVIKLAGEIKGVRYEWPCGANMCVTKTREV